MLVPKKYIEAYEMLDRMVVAAETGSIEEIRDLNSSYDKVISRVNGENVDEVNQRFKEVRDACLEYIVKKEDPNSVDFSRVARTLFDELPIPTLVGNKKERKVRKEKRWNPYKKN